MGFEPICEYSYGIIPVYVPVFYNGKYMCVTALYYTTTAIIFSQLNLYYQQLGMLLPNNPLICVRHQSCCGYVVSKLHGWCKIYL